MPVIDLQLVIKLKSKNQTYPGSVAHHQNLHYDFLVRIVNDRRPKRMFSLYRMYVAGRKRFDNSTRMYYVPFFPLQNYTYTLGRRRRTVARRHYSSYDSFIIHNHAASSSLRCSIESSHSKRESMCEPKNPEFGYVNA